MIAIARLVSHAVISAPWPKSSVEFLLLKQEERRMDECRVHLIIYIGAYQHMIDTPPLAFVAIGSSYPMAATGILRHITDTMLTDSPEGRSIGIIVEVASHQNTGIRRDRMQGVHRLTETFSHR